MSTDKQEKASKPDDKSGDDRTLTLKIGTPRGAFSADFAKTAKVSDVIGAAIKTKRLGGEPGDFEVFYGERPLVPVTRPLVSFGLKDGDELLITAQGEGV